MLEDPKKHVIHSAPDLLSANGTEALEDFPMLFVVSAKSAEALRQYLWKYLDFCRTAPTANFRSICYTTCLGREHYRYRFACVVRNMGNLIKVLDPCRVVLVLILLLVVLPLRFQAKVLIIKPWVLT